MTEHAYGRDEIVEAARRVAAGRTEPLSKREFIRLSGIPDHWIYRVFPEGGWPEIQSLAGLGPHPRNKARLSDDDLLQELHRVAVDVGRVPPMPGFDARATMASATLAKRFGGWVGASTRYREWLEAHDPTSPILATLPVKGLARPRPPADAASPAPSHPVPSRSSWAKSPGPVFGPPISFRGLTHAPINEQGVVFLFGKVSEELGFIVEAVHAAYPDREAKRRIDKRGERWQRVRVEFEYVSSNFKAHGHDPLGCDVIVCWEHDWADCPVEVVELSSVIRDLGP